MKQKSEQITNSNTENPSLPAGTLYLMPSVAK
jgi:hypothetical protein